MPMTPIPATVATTHKGILPVPDTAFASYDTLMKLTADTNELIRYPVS